MHWVVELPVLLTGTGCEMAFHNEAIYDAFTKSENLAFAGAYAIAGALVYLRQERREIENGR